MSARNQRSLLLLLPSALLAGSCATEPQAAECADGVAAEVNGYTMPTVQAAVAFAGPGDTVSVCPGTWGGNLYVDHDVVMTSMRGADVTTLDGGDQGSTLRVTNGASLRMEGFTVTGGSGTAMAGHVPGQDGLYGGGLLAIDAGDLDLRDVRFTGNTADYGGGMRILGATSLRMSDVGFDDNFATMAAGAGDVWSVGDVVSFRGEIVDNVAMSAPGLAIHDDVESCALLDMWIHENRAVGDLDGMGGALTLEADCTLTRLLVEGNSASGLAGGGLVVKDADVHLMGTLVRGNRAMVGGGVYVLATGARDVELMGDPDSRIAGNLATSDGDPGGGGGVAVHADGDVAARVTDLVIEDNTTTRGAGGGVYAEGHNGAQFVFHALTIANNAAQGDAGGGLAVWEPARGGHLPTVMAEITDSSIRDNAQGADFWQGGGGLIAYDLAGFSMSGGELARNGSGTFGGGAAVMGVDACAFAWVDVTGNVAGSMGGGIYFSPLVDGLRGAHGASCALHHVTLSANSAVYAGGMSVGGMLALHSTVLKDNFATWGGGIVITNGGLGAAVVGDAGSAIRDNVAQAGGGGVYVYSGGKGREQLHDLAIEGNVASRGGGVYHDDLFAGVCDRLDLQGVRLADNEAAEGAGGWARCPVTMADGEVVANHTGRPMGEPQAGPGGGMFLDGEATLVSTTVDWGHDETDNSPDDVYAGGMVYKQLVGSFECDAALQTCTPY